MGERTVLSTSGAETNGYTYGRVSKSLLRSHHTKKIDMDHRPKSKHF